MPITVSCECGKQVVAKDEYAGKRFKCPSCGKVQVIPGPDAPGEATPKGPKGPPAPGAIAAGKPQPKAPPRKPEVPEDLPEAGAASDDEIPEVAEEAEEAMEVEELDEEDEDEVPEAWEKKPPSRREDDDDEEEEEEEDRPRRRKRKRRKRMRIRKPIYEDMGHDYGPLDGLFINTNIVFLILFPFCCGGIAFWLGLIGVIVCKHPEAKQRAFLMLGISLLWIVFAVCAGLVGPHR